MSPVARASEASPDELEGMRRAARRLLMRPLICAEQEPETFVLIRRFDHELDRWFTQRLGYRLEVSATTARLYKSTFVPTRRPLVAPTATKRPLTQREYTMLALVLGAVAAGPRVVSLHDLILNLRSAAVEAGITLHESGRERRALITALRWMIEHGLATELHDRIDRYIDDADADAVIEVDPDRVALVPLPVLARAASTDELVSRDDRRASSLRQWLRARLVEDPATYRFDLADHEWNELRSRRAEDSAQLDEMLDLFIEARAEGVAAIDRHGGLTDRSFPATRTIGHASLLLIAELVRLALGGRGNHREADADPSDSQRGHRTGVLFGTDEVTSIIEALAARHARHWSREMVENQHRLRQAVLDLLADHRLVQCIEDGVELLPAAARFGLAEQVGEVAKRAAAAGTEPTTQEGAVSEPENEALRLW